MTADISKGVLSDVRATSRFGKKLGAMAQNGDVILLHGDLGAGKTTLTQAIAIGLEVPEEQYVSSPSFALMHEYQGRLSLYHLDCYRLHDENDIEEAGLLDYIGASGLTVIEWPDRLGHCIPAERLDITLLNSGETERHCTVQAHGSSWQGRVDNLHI